MDRRWALATLVLCAVVVVASFLPWGTLERSAQFDLGESIRVDIGEGASRVNAWNSHVGGEDFRLPNWIVPAIAAVVAALVAMHSRFRLVAPLLAAWAEVQTLWFAIALSRQERNAIGLGVVLTLAALMGVFVAQLRRPHSV